ncbi:MAG: circadian clock protein KaiB [Nitrospinae bacterium CG11_big_fil_rev_8_21_14_0_20_56_8]|nr:MAG: circadian clock protein KaiB [Nitrospinae bacterium CG11_big_fil_rev_8_21_14_0_20_56_8]
MSEPIVLKLYIAGMTPAAHRAIKNLNDICSEISNGAEYVLEVVDILLHPQLAEDEKILATPTVIKKLPPPMRRLIGDFSVKSQVLVGLDLVTSP